ncbi:MAG: hypothetical protein PHR78_03705 [Eubacteriales bacterium]|nr:hypothetical protein [Eubacteriales bacterium]MDD4324430.1 hypothetical protein [Eubacteriales bacterium]MDD4541252.1 hypothetical protein [Eubacteriales bacterium]
MIDLIVGAKGSGKTPLMLKEIESEARKENSNIVFIEHGRRLDHVVPHSIRLIDITEYPVKGYSELLAFLAGLSAKDYDITHIYIDSVFKVVGDDDPQHLVSFVKNLSAFAPKVDSNITIAVSCDQSELPAEIQEYMRELN